MNKEKLYSIGELAKLSGTTIRTIQYYDKIHLLVAKRDKNSKLRYYTQSDLLTLQQILFYKKIGFTLKDIKRHLVNVNHVDEMKHLLKQQSDILFQKEMEIKTNIAIIEAMISTIETSSNIDLEPMIEMALGFNKQTILDYTTIDFNFDQKQMARFEEKFTDFNEVVDFYWQWKKLTLEAVFHKVNHTAAKSERGYQFGKKWELFVNYATDHDPELMAVYEKGLEHSGEWPEEDLFLHQFCDDFIQEAHRYYMENRGETRC